MAVGKREDVRDRYKKEGGRGWVGGRRKKYINSEAKAEVMGHIQERQSQHQKQRQSERFK